MQQSYGLDVDLENVCRICLSQTDASQRLISIFSSAIVDGFLVSIPEVITFCVDLMITDAKGMPSKICQGCKSQLLGFYTFKKKCKRTEHVLQLTVVSSSPIPPENVESLQSIEQEAADADSNECLQPALRVDEKSSSDHEMFQCQLCDTLFSVEIKLKQHMSCHFDEEQLNTIIVDESPNVDIAAPDQENPGATTDENRSVTPDDYWVSDEPEDEECSGRLAEIEVEEDNSKSIGKEHPNEDHSLIPCSSALTCHICGKTVAGQAHFLRHMRSHEAKASFTEYFTFHICETCRKVFLDKDQLLSHVEDGCRQQEPMMETCDEAAFKCGSCSLENINEQHMKQHVLSHLSAFSCPFEGCGSEYQSFSRLGSHIVNKHVDHESHQCQHCGIDSFDSMADLQHHLRLKCKGKKFPCHHCDKKFLTQRSLAQHMKCLQKSHRCRECGKAFAQQGELKLHLRSHNGERPFQCTVCWKRYKTASLRTAHMDSHIDGKTFQCQLCGKHLQTRTCYRNHIKRHSEEKKYECDVCSKMFYTKYNVKVHKEKVHKPGKDGTNLKQKNKLN